MPTRVHNTIAPCILEGSVSSLILCIPGPLLVAQSLPPEPCLGPYRVLLKRRTSASFRTIASNRQEDRRRHTLWLVFRAICEQKVSMRSAILSGQRVQFRSEDLEAKVDI
jgi:hypothetical protein